MAAGDTIDLAGGERIIVRRSAAETDGELLELEAHYAPGRRPPPLHYHPLQEERFEVLRGAVTARVGHEERTLAEGETLVVPPEVRHTFWNAGDDEAVVRWEVRPALATEAFFRSLGDAGTRPLAQLRAAAIVARHPDEFRLARPPWPLQRAVLAPLRLLTGRSGASPVSE